MYVEMARASGSSAVSRERPRGNSSTLPGSHPLRHGRRPHGIETPQQVFGEDLYRSITASSRPRTSTSITRRRRAAAGPVAYIRPRAAGRDPSQGVQRERRARARPEADHSLSARGRDSHSLPPEGGSHILNFVASGFRRKAGLDPPTHRTARPTNRSDSLPAPQRATTVEILRKSSRVSVQMPGHTHCSSNRHARGWREGVVRNIRWTSAIASWLILSATVPYEASIVSRSFGVSPATTVTPTVFPFSITSVSTSPDACGFCWEWREAPVIFDR